MSAVMSQNFMKIGQLVQELSPKNLFSDLVLYQVALMALLAGIWLNLLLLVVATRSIWNFDHRISRKKVIGGGHGKDPHCILLYLHYNLKELGPGLTGGARSAPIREYITFID